MIEMMPGRLFISVIVPVYNGGEALRRCLRALNASTYQEYELIVVDDFSNDLSADIARDEGAIVLKMDKQSGPAACRNFGAESAKGEVLLFIDADVMARKETLSLVAIDFLEQPDTAAVFGSYDTEPTQQNFLSQYKNLLHHFVHQSSETVASTFWAGCGAIRREVFFSVGGFDSRKYPRPSIEDIELGYRLRDKGYRILLDKGIEVKHLKKWTWRSLLDADIFCRAIPWTELILETGKTVDDLNLRKSQRISAFFVGLLVPAAFLSFFSLDSILLVFFLLLLVWWINRRLFGFFYRQRGLKFGLRAFFMHLLYFLYSGSAYTLCRVKHLFWGTKKRWHVFFNRQL